MRQPNEDNAKDGPHTGIRPIHWILVIVVVGGVSFFVQSNKNDQLNDIGDKAGRDMRECLTKTTRTDCSE